MRCQFAKTGDADDGRAVVTCRRCGFTGRTRSAPEKTHADCSAPAPLGFGDTLAAALAYVGIDRWWKARAKARGTDCGCSRRQERLNDVLPYPKTLRDLIAYLRLWRQA